MRSSTSSFKYAFACCIAILLVHTFSLRFINFKIETGQSQFQENKIKMENFIFSPQTCSSAIVGSSLSYRLKNEDLGNEFCNLAFAGGSALTGLEILDSHLPENLKEVFVEMNVLRPVDRELLNSVQGPSYWLKYTLPFFQNRFQPVTLLINYLLRKSPYTAPTPTAEQFSFWLKEQQRDHADLSEQYIQLYNTNLDHLKQQITALESKGIRVTLIEIPMDPSILESDKHSFHRRRFAETFPQAKILTDASKYETDDGLHLNAESAVKFVHFIKSQIHSETR